jgi:hypothetical protein
MWEPKAEFRWAVRGDERILQQLWSNESGQRLWRKILEKQFPVDEFDPPQD